MSLGKYQFGKFDPAARKAHNKWNSTFAPEKPEPPPPIPVPTMDQGTVDRETQDLVRRRRGRAATVLTGDTPVPTGSVAVSALLG